MNIMRRATLEFAGLCWMAGKARLDTKEAKAEAERLAGLLYDTREATRCK